MNMSIVVKAQNLVPTKLNDFTIHVLIFSGPFGIMNCKVGFENSVALLCLGDVIGVASSITIQ